MSVNTTSLGALLHIRYTASSLVLYVSQHNFTGSIAACKMYCIIACIVCQSTQLHWEHCCMQDVLHHCLYCTSVNTTSLGALLHVRCTASSLVLYVSQHNFTGSIAACTIYCIIACIVRQSTQLRPGALLHIRCTASSLVLYVSQHNFTGSIAAYTIYCIIACIVCQSTQLRPGTLLHIRCTASMLVLYVSQHNFTGSIVDTIT